MSRFVDVGQVELEKVTADAPVIPGLPASLHGTRIPWGPIGKAVYRRTYSQRKEDGRQETWPESVVRAVDGNLALVDPKYTELGEREKLIELLLFFSALPAGRHLSASGMKGRQFLNNCHASGWDVEEPAAHFTFLFDALMMGGGVGANYSNRYLKQLPVVRNHVNLVVTCRPDHPNIGEFSEKVGRGEFEDFFKFYVPDTREGWVEAVELILEAAYDPKCKRSENLVIDVSGIRERGAPLKTSGGIACGPGPLVKMLFEFVEQLNSCTGRHLNSLDAMTLDHVLAACVVAGGKRRSSRMSVKNWRDGDIFDFLHCKKQDGAHWTTNISVEVDDEFFVAYQAGDAWARQVMREVTLGKAHNGEPGLWNISLARKGERDPEAMYCPNPCGEIGLQMWENCFAGDEKLITKEYGAVRFVDVVGQTVTVQTPQGWKSALISQFGEQHVQRVTLVPVRRSTGEGWQRTRSNFQVDVVVTPNHRWERLGGSVTTALAVGDTVPMNAAPFEKNESYKKGVQHGIMFGDGSADRQYTDGEWRHRVRLFGAKAEEMGRYFDHLTYPESCKGAAEAWLKSEKNLKELPLGNEGSDYLAGFLAGWSMADGSDRANGSIHLGSTHPQAEAWLRQNAAAAGWVLRAAKDSGTTETNYGERKSPLTFFTLCRPDNETLAWQVASIEALPEKVPVYCATVPGVERFTLASGITTCNCNLGHVNLGAFAKKPLAQAKEAFRLMTRWLVRATFGDVPSWRQRKVMDRNRRIGVGFFGYHEWLALNGIRYSDSHKNDWVIGRLQAFRSVVDAEAALYSSQMGIPCPVKSTTLAPTGTIVCLPGTTSSAQAMMAPWYKRLVRYSDMDPELALKKLEGYEVYPDEDAQDTSIVVFWCEDPLVAKVRASGFEPEELLEGQYDVAFEDSLALQAMLQDVWANNAISFTINLHQATMPDPETMEATLMKYLPRLKGTTVFAPVTRKNVPIQPIGKAHFDAYTGTKEVVQVEDECKTGCPV